MQNIINTFNFLGYKLDHIEDNETLFAARKELAAMINIVKIQIIFNSVNESSNIKELAAAREELFPIWKKALDPYEKDVCGFAYDCMNEIEINCKNILGREPLGFEYQQLAQ